MAISNQLDFRVKNGLVVTTTATIQSTAQSVSTTTGALQVYGGAGIGGNIVIGGSSTVTNNEVILGTTAAISTLTGALQVRGGAGIGGSVYVGGVVTATSFIGNLTGTAALATTSTNLAGGAAGSIPMQVSLGVTAYIPLGSSGYVLTAGTNTATWQAVSGLSAGTATNANFILTTQQTASASYYPTFVDTNNASSLYEAVYTTSSFSINPGTGLVTVNSLSVGGPTTFNGPVTFNGTASYILSTNTYYTDNLLELHTPPSGVYGQWTSDDGKDVGFRFHYFNRSLSTDSNAALVLASDTQYLEFYSTGAESSTGTFTTATYGTFKTGNILLTGSAAASSTNTGALQVAGGVGVAGGMVVGGYTTSTGFYTPIGFAQRPTIDYEISANYISAASGINVGRSGNGFILFGDGFTPAGILGNPSSIKAYVNNDQSGGQLWYGNATGLIVGPGSTPTATLDVRGRAVVTSATNSISTATGALNVVGGVGVGGNIFVGTPQVFTTASNWDTNKRLINVGGISTLYNDSGVSTYLAHNYYQNGANSTYITTGTAGYYAISGNLHGWGIATSGTPGTPVTFTQALTLQTDGSLNVGYVSAQQGAKLSVNGGGYFNGIVTATNFILNGYPVSTGTVSGGSSSAVSVQYTLTNAIFYPVFVSQNTATSTSLYEYTTSTLSVNPGARVVSVNSTVPSTSTTTGALTVTGGVGIGGDLYAGSIYTNNSRIIPSLITEFTATAGQTVFSVSYTVGTVQVFANGIQLGSADYTATNGTSITLAIARNLGDIIRVIAGVSTTPSPTVVTFTPIIANDISNQFNGINTVFALRQDQSPINTIVDSKDVDVVVNGQYLVPYVDTYRWPWITPFDSGGSNGFRISNSNLIIYKAPPVGSVATVIVRSNSSTRQKRRYPYSATTIALGD